MSASRAAVPGFAVDELMLSSFIEHFPNATVSFDGFGTGETPEERALGLCRGLIDSGLVKVDGVAPENVLFHVTEGPEPSLEWSVRGTEDWRAIAINRFDATAVAYLQAVAFVREVSERALFAWKPGLLDGSP
jgi:hypothetical protein